MANLANCLWFAKLKPSKLLLIINNLLADLLICKIFFHQMLETSQFTKLSPRQLSLHVVYLNKVAQLIFMVNRIYTGAHTNRIDDAA